MITYTIVGVPYENYSIMRERVTASCDKGSLKGSKRILRGLGFRVRLARLSSKKGFAYLLFRDLALSVLCVLLCDSMSVAPCVLQTPKEEFQEPAGKPVLNLEEPAQPP